ncbi:hypothetical protein [Emcibacter sp.]|uniref:hypothetical protein n=1 Tax=Emcibacter sp. TaxID=1979954 RepID=UPI002AA87077|nr:hypothetical protein [Emcibacter sp.]
MKRSIGIVILASAVGFILTGSVSYAQMKVETVDFDMQPLSVSFEDTSRASASGPSDEVEIIFDAPTAETADQFIFLKDPVAEENRKKKSGFKVEKSSESKPSLLFNMQPLDTSGSGVQLSSGLLDGLMAGNRVTFSYGPADRSLDPKTFDISVGSSFLISPSSIMSPLYDGSQYDLRNRQVYNLSLDVAYAGFSIGASFSRERNLVDLDLSGYDVGLGYHGRSWFTDVRFAEYRRKQEYEYLSSTIDYFDKVYALEVGAGYSLLPNLHFTGRFTYYSYGQNAEQDPLSDTQVFLLGTNVNF